MAADGIDTSATLETDLAQAFKDLSKGERTAAALESHLTSLEHKLDGFLASLNEDMPAVAARAAATSGMRERAGSGAMEEGRGGEHGKDGIGVEGVNGR